MPDSDEVNSPQPPPPQMDLDPDLGVSSWPLDHILFPPSSNAMSPFLLPSSSSSEQPCSPLWAFSDAAADDFLRLPSSTSFLATSGACGGGGAGGFFVTSNVNSVAESRTQNVDDKKVPSPFLGLVPVEYGDGFCIFKERLTQALRYFKESTEQHVLAQFWAPVKKGGRNVLTTSGQPFVLNPHGNGLNQYRMVSLMYMFSVDGESDVELGLPGRVFRHKMPEWTPDVQYYSSKEYSRLHHALHYNVRGTLALPVFEPSGQSCVGVLELIMTSQKINYAPEVDKVCKALQAVNLTSSEILDPPKTQICNEGRQNALAEILEILTVVSETHKLPLAQTWVPCMHRSVLANGGGLKKSCTSFDGSCNGQVCMSTTDVAFYIVDAHMWGFREACLEHHLQKGQGVVGRAFYSRNSCFCGDITQFCKTDYPLVHYARMFHLTGCFAICLRSSYTGDDDYILEFLLPPSLTDSDKQESLLGSILATMKQHFQSLSVASGMDLNEEEGFMEIIQAYTRGRPDVRLECIRIPPSTEPPLDGKVLLNGGIVQLDTPKPQLMIDLDVKDNGVSILHVDRSHTPAGNGKKDTKKPSERKRGKTEKTISLEVLQQYFAGSLKDAAKSLGVCPTTMKRICRQHGISRWPSRKIKKVSHSLTKLKRVIESVQGSNGTFALAPLTTSPPPVPIGSKPLPSNMNGYNQETSPKSKPDDPYGDNNVSPPCKTTGGNGHAGIGGQLPVGKVLSEQKRAMQNGFSPEMVQGSNRSKTRSGSRDESVGTPTSHDSCQGSPVNNGTPAKDPSVSPIHVEHIEARASPELPFHLRELNLSTAYSKPDALITTEDEQLFGGMLIEDAGSSKDLRNLCPQVAEAIVDERVRESSWKNPPCRDLTLSQPMSAFKQPHTIARQETMSVTVKATYREDVIRFRIFLGSGISELKEEVAKRLKLEIGTFDIKYLDDDHEWVLIACNADLQECLDISRLSGSSIIRLSVHDLNTNLGSSCDSTGEL